MCTDGFKKENVRSLNPQLEVSSGKLSDHEEKKKTQEKTTK